MRELTSPLQLQSQQSDRARLAVSYQKVTTKPAYRLTPGTTHCWRYGVKKKEKEKQYQSKEKKSLDARASKSCLCENLENVCAKSC